MLFSITLISFVQEEEEEEVAGRQIDCFFPCFSSRFHPHRYDRYYRIPTKIIDRYRGPKGGDSNTVVIRDNERRRGWMANKSAGKSSFERPMIRASLSLSLSRTNRATIERRKDRSIDDNDDDGLIIATVGENCFRRRILPPPFFVHETRLLRLNNKLFSVGL